MNLPLYQTCTRVDLKTALMSSGSSFRSSAFAVCLRSSMIWYEVVAPISACINALGKSEKRTKHASYKLWLRKLLQPGSVGKQKCALYTSHFLERLRRVPEWYRAANILPECPGRYVTIDELFSKRDAIQTRMFEGKIRPAISFPSTLLQHLAVFSDLTRNDEKAITCAAADLSTLPRY